MQEEGKERKKRKRRKKNYLLRLLLVIALGTGLYFLLTSPLFDVQKIAVENNSYYTKEQVADKARAKTGQNIFAAKTGEMKKALLKDPYIKNARVKRTLPKTIVIEVEERKEAAAIPYAEMYVIIDGDGLVLRKSEVEPKLTLLAGMTIRSMEDGRPLEVEETSALTETLVLLETMKNTDLFFKKIDISNVIIKAYIYDQLVCRGTPENMIKSMESGTLETFLRDLYTKGIERGMINVGGDNVYSHNPMVE